MAGSTKGQMKSIAILNGEKGTVHILPNCISESQSNAGVQSDAEEAVDEWCERQGVSANNINWQVFDGTIRLEDML